MAAISRLFSIIWVLCRYRLDDFIASDKLPLLPRIILLIGPWRLFPRQQLSAPARLRLALEQLGPVFVKFGQMLSTRRDLLSEELANELTKLQDDVPPFPSDEAIQLIESQLEGKIDQLFKSFDSQALASASIAQVHCATLHSGEEVVVKVVRPGIEKTIEKDIKLLQLIAAFVQKYHPDGKRLRATEVVEDYRHTIFDELDLQREAANTSQLRRNFENSDLLYIPEVMWDYTRSRVLVLERINGIPVTDLEQLNAQATDMKVLAERGCEIFFTQVFRDNFFHADMHPGNIFVARNNPTNPQYIGIDCAIIGSLSEAELYYLARNLLAIFNRDYRLVAELHVECGWVPAHTRVNDFEAAIRAVCEPIFEKPLGEISFGHLLIYLFQTARRFEMEVQPSLVLLQKTLLNVEGLGRQLYPELDLWQTAKPFLEGWIRDRYSPSNVGKLLRKYGPGWLEQLPHIPDLVYNNLQQQTPQEPAPKSSLEHGGWTALAIASLLAVVPAAAEQFDSDFSLPAATWFVCGIAATLFYLRR